MYKLLNQDKETAITRINPHRDFYNVRKVLVSAASKACQQGIINPHRDFYNVRKVLAAEGLMHS